MMCVGKLLCCMWISGVASFTVSVPEMNLVAVRGHPVVLGCTFTPDSDPSTLVVTWQRKEDSQVVHSFYYQQDQLGHQSPQYHNRTSLFFSELAKGNASLRLSSVLFQDVGQYLCLVTNAKGSGKAMIELDYGAFYTEPRLSVYINSTTLTAQVETEGFPRPEVIWLGEHGQIVTHQLSEETEDGLCFIRSSYETRKPVINVTFTLKNLFLNQTLQRPLLITNVSGEAGNRRITVISLSVVTIVLLAAVMFLLFRQNIKSVYL